MFIFARYNKVKMAENIISRNSLRAWLLASRPKTLTGAAVPVMIALALTFKDAGPAGFNALPAMLCLLFAFIMQIDANFINDYFDFIKGNDDETRLGPRRACSQGWISPRAMKTGIAVTTTLACLVGLPLIFYGGWLMIGIGALCVAFCFLYTTRLSYLGLGDLLVLVFFGIVPVCLTYYLQTKTVTFEALTASVACGFVIDTLLIVNNYRDIDNDKKAGKRTLIVRIGARNGQRAYLISGIIPCLLGFFFLANGSYAAFSLPLIYILLHYSAYKEMVNIKKGKALNIILGKTARNMFIYGLFVSAGLLLGRL